MLAESYRWRRNYLANTGVSKQRHHERGCRAEERYRGTPQRGPLSPLMVNMMLDEVDKVLDKHGHSFARYADDCNVYVQS
ncbi:MAG: reverse transcriptase domain-containing protein [Nitrosomonas sp.]|uniref:reverse transcriptase domain-containing protein n=1 Tax=Nitrosomonas sp. TaxID=42353 RepID=UPI002718CCBD|nr:reverse transcriptase domain-containing protein [Nitrosomonas sp.]MDO8893369.1 reverse transcriptase domain-containing protein [Nitrosomonas sp.]MDO9470989.1 reverse transcriptase domain-containing protein [Nitrosomonas sp.]MDP1788375.1 reverse transcriptase domain-containing protein [Nitrosomonas sp.]MDP2223570.1 reverse transcriptase domain-containing protein [Nitrosomonas sp.]